MPEHLRQATHAKRAYTMAIQIEKHEHNPEGGKDGPQEKHA